MGRWWEDLDVVQCYNSDAPGLEIAQSDTKKHHIAVIFRNLKTSLAIYFSVSSYQDCHFSFLSLQFSIVRKTGRVTVDTNLLREGKASKFVDMYIK